MRTPEAVPTVRLGMESLRRIPLPGPTAYVEFDEYGEVKTVNLLAPHVRDRMGEEELRLWDQDFANHNPFILGQRADWKEGLLREVIDAAVPVGPIVTERRPAEQEYASPARGSVPAVHCPKRPKTIFERFPWYWKRYTPQMWEVFYRYRERLNKWVGLVPAHYLSEYCDYCREWSAACDGTHEPPERYFRISRGVMCTAFADYAPPPPVRDYVKVDHGNDRQHRLAFYGRKRGHRIQHPKKHDFTYMMGHHPHRGGGLVSWRKPKPGGNPQGAMWFATIYRANEAAVERIWGELSPRQREVADLYFLWPYLTQAEIAARLKYANKGGVSKIIDRVRKKFREAGLPDPISAREARGKAPDAIQSNDLKQIIHFSRNQWEESRSRAAEQIAITQIEEEEGQE